MIGGGTASSVSAAAPLASSLPVELSAADRARVDQALRDSRAGNTRAQYRSAWRGWAEWAALAGHQALPADPLTVAAYLAERVADGAAAATVRTIRAAIRAGHVDTGADDPTGHDGVRRVLQGLARQAAGRGRGQADPLTADDVAAILATARIPRRTGRGMESEADAADRGATDRALVAVLFQGGLRRSEAAALGGRAGRGGRAGPFAACASCRCNHPGHDGHRCRDPPCLFHAHRNLPVAAAPGHAACAFRFASAVRSQRAAPSPSSATKRAGSSAAGPASAALRTSGDILDTTKAPPERSQGVQNSTASIQQLSSSKPN